MKVLLATDAPWVEASVSASLTEPEFDVHMVTDGSKVAGAVAEFQPDLVILDLQLGNMGAVASGIDLENMLPERLPVLMLLDREADTWLARRFGASGWLIKPVMPAELADLSRRIACNATAGSPRD